MNGSAVGAQCGSVARIGQIEEALGAATGALERLEASLTRLEGRLLPVLSPPGPTGGSPGGHPPSPARAALAERILSLAQVADALEERVAAISARVEL